MRINIRAIIIRNNSILLCKNKKHNFYFLPGGGLEEFETINDCIIREFKEEMNINSNQIIIDNNMKIIEHIFESEEQRFHEINILKNVFINANQIFSIENHIEFEEISLKDLKLYNILPVKIKDYLINQFE